MVIDRTKTQIIKETDRKAYKRDYATVMTLLCGVRVIELLALDRDDIEISDRKGILHIQKGKGYKERHVPIPASVQGELLRFT